MRFHAAPPQWRKLGVSPGVRYGVSVTSCLWLLLRAAPAWRKRGVRFGVRCHQAVVASVVARVVALILAIVQNLGVTGGRDRTGVEAHVQRAPRQEW